MNAAKLSVKVEYGIGNLALDAALEVDGQPVALIGPNGCGKSTLLLTILGVRPPTRGKVTCGGQTLFDSAAGVWCPTEERKMAYLPQDFGLFPFMTVLGNVEFALACQIDKMGRQARHSTAMACLERFGVRHLAQRHPGELSGGERQRVALARAVVSQPRAVLLDEPTASLDVGARAEVRRLLLSSLRELSVAAIIVTHDRGDIEALAGRVAVMDAGRILSCTSLAEAQRNPPNAFAARLLGGALPSRSDPPPEGLSS